MSASYDFSTGAFVVSDAALERLRKYRQTYWRRKEAGGVLLGRHLIDGADVIVDEVTVPQRNDKRSRFSFFRSGDHQDIVLGNWKASRGTQTYLGLWHSHPEPNPTPSSVDLHDWRSACRRDRYFGERLFFIILGTKTFGVWHGTRDGAIRKLDLRQQHGEES